MVKLSLQTLEWIGLVFVSLRSLSITVLQRGVLQLDNDSAWQRLQEGMPPDVMGWVTGAVICTLLATFSIPIFAKAAYEGWRRAKDSTKYLAGLALCAVVSEIPYDFAINGELLDGSVQNPVWGLLLGSVGLEILKRWRPQSKARSILFSFVIILASLAWTVLLRVYMGPVLVLLMALFYFAEKRKAAVLLGGILLTLLQFPAPVGMIFVHWYDREKEGGSGKVLWVLFPLQLVVFGLLGMLLA